MPDAEEGRGGVADGSSEHPAPTTVRPVSCTHSPRDDRSYPAPTTLGKHTSPEKIQKKKNSTGINSHQRPWKAHVGQISGKVGGECIARFWGCLDLELAR